MRSNGKCVLGRCKHGGMYAGGYHPELAKGRCPICGGLLDQKYGGSPIWLSPESWNFSQLTPPERLLFCLVYTGKIIIGKGQW